MELLMSLLALLVVGMTRDWILQLRSQVILPLFCLLANPFVRSRSQVPPYAAAAKAE